MYAWQQDTSWLAGACADGGQHATSVRGETDASWYPNQPAAEEPAYTGHAA
jgi:hypothetical protein